MADFKTALAEGKGFEELTLSDITKKICPLAYMNMKIEEYSYYDIILFNGKFPIIIEEQKTIECKFDKLGYESKNICIEIGCWGRQSGLLVTKAFAWIISDGETTFIAKTSRIRDCIIENTHQIEYRKKDLALDWAYCLKIQFLDDKGAGVVERGI